MKPNNEDGLLRKENKPNDMGMTSCRTWDWTIRTTICLTPLFSHKAWICMWNVLETLWTTWSVISAWIFLLLFWARDTNSRFIKRMQPFAKNLEIKVSVSVNIRWNQKDIHRDGFCLIVFPVWPWAKLTGSMCLQSYSFLNLDLHVAYRNWWRYLANSY